MKFSWTEKPSFYYDVWELGLLIVSWSGDKDFGWEWEFIDTKTLPRKLRHHPLVDGRSHFESATDALQDAEEKLTSFVEIRDSD